MEVDMKVNDEHINLSVSSWDRTGLPLTELFSQSAGGSWQLRLAAALRYGNSKSTACMD